MRGADSHVAFDLRELGILPSFLMNGNFGNMASPTAYRKLQG